MAVLHYIKNYFFSIFLKNCFFASELLPIVNLKSNYGKPIGYRNLIYFTHKSKTINRNNFGDKNGQFLLCLFVSQIVCHRVWNKEITFLMCLSEKPFLFVEEGSYFISSFYLKKRFPCKSEEWLWFKLYTCM